MGAVAWKVYLGKTHMDTVFMATMLSARDVLKDLIEREGYDPRITIKRSL